MVSNRWYWSLRYKTYSILLSLMFLLMLHGCSVGFFSTHYISHDSDGAEVSSNVANGLGLDFGEVNGGLGDFSKTSISTPANEKDTAIKNKKTSLLGMSESEITIERKTISNEKVTIVKEKKRGLFGGYDSIMIIESPSEIRTLVNDENTFISVGPQSFKIISNPSGNKQQNKKTEPFNNGKINNQQSIPAPKLNTP